MQTLNDVLTEGYQPDYEKIADSFRGLFEVEKGDIVILPDWYRLKNRQRRINVIHYVNEAGGYIYMTAMLNNGKPSNDRRAAVYWPIKNITDLEEIEK